MAVLSLPLSFNNSFWSQDYRRGLEVLYHKLEQGVAENDQVIAFIRARAAAEGQLANALSNAPAGKPGVGFRADDGASLLMAFQGLQAESVSQAQIHRAIEKELDSLVATPFEEWAVGYKDRLQQSKNVVLNEWLRGYELAIADVAKLKQQYLAKTRKADEAEEDARFAPNSNGAAADNYTTSPRLRPIDARTSAPQRTASVSERIAQRLKDIQKRSVGALSGDSAISGATPQSTVFSAEPESETESPKLDKGKGKAVEDVAPPVLSSPTPMSPLLPPKVDIPPPPSSVGEIVLAGVPMPFSAVSQLLTRAANEINLRPVRFPLLGEYQDCFSGEEFVMWLKDNIPAFEGSLDRAEDAAQTLTEQENLLRRVGEFGNAFEGADDAFYQFRPKAFNVDGKAPEIMSSPIKNIQTGEILKRTNNFVSLVSKAIAVNNTNEPAFVRARHEAEEADKAYRVAVRQLDRRRLHLEERFEDSFKTLQRWETERLRAIKTVLLQFQGTLANLPKSLESSLERQSTLIAAYQPENDLTALIERYRTGPFRPDPQVYESVFHDECDTVFGIDLRKWGEGGVGLLSVSPEKKEAIPEVLSALLRALTTGYEKLPSDVEKRKAWIYEVPLVNVHHIREALNAVPPESPIPSELFAPYDVPVIAAAVKLWLLELDPPVALYEGWDDFRKLYPAMGATTIIKPDEEDALEAKIREVGAALQKLPRIHLYVLDAVVSHLRKLIDTTTVEEPDEVFITKLALALGRTIVRPKIETELSIQDRHPTLLFIDLLQYYDKLLPPTIVRKKRESERKVPIRKRTAPIDMRLSRSRLSVGGGDAKQLLAAQQAAQQGLKSPEKQAPPPVPPIPSHIHQPSPRPPPQPATKLEESALPPPPPPPVFAEPEAFGDAELNPTPPPPPPPVSNPDAPARPAFKTPPPEDDDLPPRPAFKDPAPESEDDDAPPRPNFAEPAAEDSDASSPAVSPPTTSVIPPTPDNRPLKRTNVSSRSGSPAPSSPDDNKPAASRTTSAGVRGPRIARGPRAPGGNVSSMVSNLNRNSVSSASPSSPTPSYKRLSGSPSRRPSSVLGRSSAFSRRTMASDAEDDVVDK